MNRFGTDLFRFDLPGEDWVESTIQMYTPKGSDASVFMITRSDRVGEPGDLLDTALKNFPKSPDLELELVRSGPNKVGLLEAWDTGFVKRTQLSAEYIRFLSVGYYDRELHFCWAGPAAERVVIDERAERSKDTVRFRSR